MVGRLAKPSACRSRMLHTAPGMRSPKCMISHLSTNQRHILKALLLPQHSPNSAAPELSCRTIQYENELQIPTWKVMMMNQMVKKM